MPPSPPVGNEWHRITVITPSFNQARFLEETLRSVLLQGYPNLEYLVLDGGSQDGSVEIIQKYSDWIDYWTSEPDGGQSAAINRGLGMGTGRMATWINSDDLLCRNALVEHASRREHLSETESGSPPVYLGTCLKMDIDGRVFSSQRGRIHSLEDLVRVRTIWRAGGFIVQPEVLFPRALALEVGGLDPNKHYSMDYELWGKLLLAGVEFRYTDIPFAMFRCHPDQKTADDVWPTHALLETATQLIQAGSFSKPLEDELLRELETYRREFEHAEWTGSGRLARLGLPRRLVTALRNLKAGGRAGEA